MKLIGRTLAILAAAGVVVGFLMIIGMLSGGSVSAASAMGGHEMQGGFNLGGIVEILPTLAIVGIITAIVSPLKQRLISKRRPGAAARRPQPATSAVV